MNAYDTLSSITNRLRGHKWKVYFPNIPGGSYGKALSMLVRSSKIPGVNTVLATDTYEGITIHVPVGAAKNGTVSWTFVETEDLPISKAFEAWIKLIFDIDTGIGSSDLECMADAYTYLYSADDTLLAKYHLMRVFPTGLSDINLSPNLSGFISRSLSVQYDNWQREG